MAHEITSPASIFPDNNWPVLVSLETDPKCFQKVIMKYIIYLMEFSTLIPTELSNRFYCLTLLQAMRYFFGVPQYVCTMHYT